jgi:hypothetical protein
MILNKQQFQPFVDSEGVYECSLITQPFAYKIFNEEVSPFGDIVGFQVPARVGPLSIEEAFVIAMELPNVDSFGGACFSRLYAAQLGSLLSVLTPKQYYVEENSLFTDDLQASLMVSNSYKDSMLINIIFPIIMYSNNNLFAMLELDSQRFEDFQLNVVNSFKYLTKSIFIETRRDNF